MELTEELVAHLARELHGTTVLTYGGRELDLTPPWRRASMIDLIEEQIGVRVDVRMTSTSCGTSAGSTASR